MFKKGDYIVVVWPDKPDDNYLSNGFVYKQTIAKNFLHVENDNVGGVTSNFEISYKSNKWRYATLEETRLYEKYGKPVKGLNAAYEIY